jgi:flagellar motor switch protein FliN
MSIETVTKEQTSMSAEEQPGAGVATHTRPVSAIRDLSIGQIPVSVQVVLGSASMSIAELGAIEPDAIIRLNKRVGDPVDILVNGRLIGRGEIVVLDGDDACFAISMLEVATSSYDPSGRL